MSELVLKTLACRGLRVGPSKDLLTCKKDGDTDFNSEGMKIFNFEWTASAL